VDIPRAPTKNRKRYVQAGVGAGGLMDATLESKGAVEVGWETRNGQVDVWVRDEGAGLADTANLFVPFYTTKPDGSGIGLALSRQIAEAHGGTLTLSNQASGLGCEARLTLPAD